MDFVAQHEARVQSPVFFALYFYHQCFLTSMELFPDASGQERWKNRLKITCDTTAVTATVSEHFIGLTYSGMCDLLRVC